MCELFLLAALGGSLMTNPLLVDLHPRPVIPGADATADELCPLEIRRRMEDVAGGARLHHYGICHTYRARAYSARFTDSTGIENLITIRLDGMEIYVEPYLTTAAGHVPDAIEINTR